VSFRRTTLDPRLRGDDEVEGGNDEVELGVTRLNPGMTSETGDDEQKQKIERSFSKPR
jgi:hypothetical protein